jgi:glycosyltransferase involved in cell wall biosynthesis
MVEISVDPDHRSATDLDRVSVVIPLYNRAGAIEDAVRSVLRQTYPSFEVIVVDDGSSDDGAAVAEAIQDDRIRVIRLPENRGGGAARTAGIEAASAPWIAFLDSDDAWDPDKLERQMAALKASPQPANSICYCNIRIVEAGREIGLWNRRGPLPREDVSDYLITHEQAVQTSCILLSTELARRIRFDPRLRRHQDWDFVLRAVHGGAALTYVDQPLATYVRAPAGLGVSTHPNPQPSIFWLQEARGMLSPRAIARFEVQQIYPRLVGTQPGEAQKIILRSTASLRVSWLRLLRTVASSGPLGRAWRRLKGGARTIPSQPNPTADTVRTSVLISAPSLDPTKNVSGVSRVCLELMAALTGTVALNHLLVGRRDGSRLSGPRNALSAGHRLATGTEAVFHSNTALTLQSVARDLVLCALARATGKRVLLHVHGGRFMAAPTETVFRPLIEALFLFSDRIVVLSRTEAAWLAERYPRTADKVEPIYNFSLLADRRLAEQPSSGPGHHPLKVVFVGRLVPEKGIQALLEAVGARYAVPVGFTVYGDGALAGQVRDAASRFDNLTFAGVFSGDPAGMFADADLLVLPSLYGEGMPMVIIEAMSSGCIPVASAIGSIPEMIQDGETGFLIEGDLTRTLSKIADLAASTPTALSQISANARAFATENFSPTKNAQAFARIYETLRRRP